MLDEIEIEKCEVCGKEIHDSLCPNNIINSDIYQYWESQIDNYE